MRGHVVATPANTVTLSKRLLVARVIACGSGAVLQVCGLYAGLVTFGVWTTLGAYAISALAVVAQQMILARCAR